MVNEFPQAPDARRGWPAGADRHGHQAVIVKDDTDTVGLLRGSIYWVLLLWHCFAVTKPLSQIQKSTLWPLQDANPTPSLGGFGLSGDSATAEA